MANPPKENITTGSLANIEKKFISDSYYANIGAYDYLIYKNI